MTKANDPQELVREVKELANKHFLSPEFQYYLDTRFTAPRARCWAIHQVHFVRHRRDCWALAMGHAPLDVKKGIWLHEQDELIGDYRAGGEDHSLLVTREAELFGVSQTDLDEAELHPFVAAAFEAWLHLGKKSWLESFASASVVEMVNSDAVVAGGGHSSRIRQKLISELGIRPELLKNRNVHIEADQEHVGLFDQVASRHVKGDFERALVMNAVRHALIIDRAFRGALGFAMRQIP